MTQDIDAIIIGTGVIGGAVAFEMSKAGYKTLSLDRNREKGQGSTAGSCACIRMHYSTFDGTAFAWEGYHYWRDWKDYLGLPDDAPLSRLVETGCLVWKSEHNGYLEKHMKNSDDLDCPYEDLTAEQIKERLPIVSLDSFIPAKARDDDNFGKSNGGKMTGGVFWPNAGHVTDPALSAQNLCDAAAMHGAKFRLGVEVVDILKENGNVAGVKLADGEEIRAQIVVNVAGPGSLYINRMAAVEDEMTITTRPLRQEVVHIPAPEGFDYENNGFMMSDSDIACYMRPEHGNNILIGSEDPECDEHYWVDSDTDYDREFTEQWTTQAMRAAQRIPGLPLNAPTRGVVDLYDASTDWIPIYDKTSLSGYYMACGSSGNQYKNAPIAGKMMLALIEYCEAGHDHDVEPLQYTMPYTGKTIDVGFYSRKREINEESSFSVLG